MKKQLESELISIAHKILKLAGREDLGKMEAEISTLYQKITILKFLEDNQLDPITNSKDLTQTFFDSVTPAEEGIKKIKTVKQKEPEHETTPVETTKKTQDAAANKELDAITQDSKDSEAVQKEEVFDNNSNLFSETIEGDLSALSPSYSQLPIFDAKHDIAEKPSLNDKLKPQGFQIGLNDRLAFVKGLFDNSNEDYDRVLSQLNTLGSYNDATTLLDTIIKPDYNNWKDHEELEARFLEIIEDKFN